MIAAHLLSLKALWLGNLAYIAVFLWAAIRAPWVELVNDSRKQHLLFGTILAIFLLWLVRRDFGSGLSVHFLGMAATTLLLNAPLAILAATLAQLALCVTGHSQFIALGLNGMLQIVIPVFITQLCANAVERRQPENLFVFIFCAGFFPAALGLAACVLASTAVLWLDGYAMPPWLTDFAPYLWLIMFPEAFINGMLISALVVFKPEWLETFNRTRYLQTPPDER